MLYANCQLASSSATVEVLPRFNNTFVMAEHENTVTGQADEVRDQHENDTLDPVNAEDLLDGTAYHINSRRLKTRQLRRIAAALGLAESASAEDTRTIIEGKLREMDKDPAEVQVIVKDLEGNDGTLFLINDEGVIITVKALLDSHVTSETTSTTSSCSALRSKHDSRSSSAEPNPLEATVKELRSALEEEQQRAANHLAELTSAKEALAREKQKVKRMWRDKCEQLLRHEDQQDAKDAEIQSLKAELARLRASHERTSEERMRSSSVPSNSEGLSSNDGGGLLISPQHEISGRTQSARVGKAPPIDTFTGENPDTLWEDWLPTFERAAHWNHWTEEEKLLQLAGYLRKKALQEWNLMSETQKHSFKIATKEMQNRLDPGSKALAAQDFRHTVQGPKESVSDFIRRLEQVFRRAYGKEQISAETRSTLLHGQLQDGLSDILMRAPAVSGALTYQELCGAAKNEERRQKDLSKRHQYQREDSTTPSSSSNIQRNTQARTQADRRGHLAPGSSSSGKRCYICDSTEHLMKNCRVRTTESLGNTSGTQRRATVSRQVPGRRVEKNSSVAVVSSDPATVTTDHTIVTTDLATVTTSSPQCENLLDILYSDSDTDSEVKVIKVPDNGSKSQCVHIQIQGVPAYGIIDTAADITIIGGKLFTRVATIARLKKKALKPADKMPRTYDQCTFTLDGRMDLDISFNGRTMCTPVYIKMDAVDQLLLAEGVCRQLGIVQYHADVETWRGNSKQKEPHLDNTGTVPMIRVSMLQSTRVLPHHGTLATVKVEGKIELSKPLILQPEETMDCRLRNPC